MKTRKTARIVRIQSPENPIGKQLEAEEIGRQAGEEQFSIACLLLTPSQFYPSLGENFPFDIFTFEDTIHALKGLDSIRGLKLSQGT